MHVPVLKHILSLSVSLPVSLSHTPIHMQTDTYKHMHTHICTRDLVVKQWNQDCFKDIR